ncbi:15423_t:CDS:2 [Funneliformis mosseae]|uniref:15423_t:CDS:1 n=1 Tax=Funneliformis mosseae TaxID=27381 RepID=A0A9N9HGA5_FUNMO|nr:15423_t:CDS:2 [Funneliformis mosseae]
MTVNENISDFKIFNKKDIIYKVADDAKVKLYDLENQKEITNNIYNQFEYNYTNFLKDGDFVLFNTP